jgi:hypothetical protein
MQKVTYVLLQRHANSYWQTERDDDNRSGILLKTIYLKNLSTDTGFFTIVASPAKRRRPATICAVSDGGKEPFPGLNEMMSKLADREKMTTTPPGIQPHHHQQALSRPNSTLWPIITPAQQRENNITHGPNNNTFNTGLATTFNTAIDIVNDDNPPPVPPKPIVIRSDQMFDPTLSTPPPPPPPSIQRWQFTPVQQRRQSMW